MSPAKFNGWKVMNLNIETFIIKYNLAISWQISAAIVSTKPMNRAIWIHVHADSLFDKNEISAVFY